MVEKWLLQVEDQMITSIRVVISKAMEAYKHAVRDKWVLEWAGQIVICVSCIYWTAQVIEVMENTATNVRNMCL